MATRTSLPGGLSSAEAEQRLRDLGPNLPPTAVRQSLASRVGDQLRDPMIIVLQVAAILSAVLRDWPSTTIISAVVVFNTAAGVVQQYRADRVMAELTRLAAPSALARRDGILVTVSAQLLVPGDVVALASGDVVPADADILESYALEIDESPVTGESLPVPRAAGEELLGGTRVVGGRAIALVTRTGAASNLGKIASLLNAGGTRSTPLQRRLARLSRVLVVLVVSLSTVAVAVGVLQGRPWGQMVLVGLSLMVAAVPESLPAVATIALALSAHRMAQRHVVVRTLPAVETLGSVTVVATDKTGTITEGRMAAQVLWLEGEHLEVDDARLESDPGAQRLMRSLVLCNDAELALDEDGAWQASGEAMEGALLAMVVASRGDVAATRLAWPRIGEVPFDHAARAMTTHHRSAEGRTLSVCKGAPEAVLALVADGCQAPQAVLEAAEQLAATGLRVIAVADREESGPWALLGLVGIGDPPRASAAAVVARLKRAGIRLVLVTGDHPGTAAAVARRVGIGGPDDEVVEGRDLDRVPADRRHDLSVVARVAPEQKVHVVTWLQEQGEVVAMIGDGVNDAPALRHADIGVAAGLSGSEVAKEAADLVLTDDELSSVVAAVEEGRRIFANIRSFLLYAVSGGLAEVGVMLTGGLVGLTVPLLPGQILWINLLTHGLVGVAFGSEPLDSRLMSEPPRPPSEAMFTRPAVVRLAVVTALLVLEAMLLGALTSGDAEVRRTMIFLGLGAGQLGVALALRSTRTGWTVRGRGLELALLGAMALMLAAVWLPPFRTLLETAYASPAAIALALAVAAVPGLVLRVWLRGTRARR